MGQNGQTGRLESGKTGGLGIGLFSARKAGYNIQDEKNQKAGNVEKTLERLDALAMQAAMMEASPSDLKVLVEPSQRVDEIRSLRSGEQPPEPALVFDGLSKTFDKFILN